MGEHETQNARRKGVVKWFNASKGFGFITPDEGDEELFVHQSTIKAEGFRSLREGERVEFDLESGEDGRNKAINVTGPDGQPPQGAPPVPRYPVPPYAFPGPPPGSYYPSHTRPEGTPGQPAGYPGYYFYYVPGPRYPGPWNEGMMQPVMMRPSRGMTRPPSSPFRPSPPHTGKTSGLQVVVHNLPWSCTWQRLKEVFSEWEVVRADVIVDEYGRSRGFGTVRFSSEQDATAAIEAINGIEMDGRKITVRLDRYA